MATVNMNGLKDAIQTALTSANTTTASTDLSSGLETRVQKILTVNPSMIPIQSTFYPYVTVYIDAKDVEEMTLAKNQSNGRRKATVDMKIVGAVWNSTITDDATDDADDDCESLMENIEEIMKNNTTLGGYATWSFPVTVTYHNLKIAEHASLRAGMMTYRATVIY